MRRCARCSLPAFTDRSHRGLASSEDWGQTVLGDRIERAAEEFVALIGADAQGRIRGESWGRYQHELGSNGGQELGIDLDSDLMRLATGGSATIEPEPW